jgi:hypothetical protein
MVARQSSRHVDIELDLVSRATAQRDPYDGHDPRPRHNQLLVVTDTADLAEARDVVEAVLAHG